MYIFKSPNEFDFRSASVMGLSAKMDEFNAIGKYGTGLKYAIAIVLRHGGTFVIKSGYDTYAFGIEGQNFRGKEFNAIVCIHSCSDEEDTFVKSIDMPFTTQYGREWEAWMAFRELASNCKDESGSYYYDPDFTTINTESPLYVNGTEMYVHCDGFTAQKEDIDSIFLEKDASKLIFSNEGINIYDTDPKVPVKYLYNNGIRGYRMHIKTRYIYDFVNAKLSEDRTIESATFLMEYYFKQAISQCVQNDNPDALERLLGAEHYNYEDKDTMPNKYHECFTTLDTFNEKLYEALYLFTKEVHVYSKFMRTIIEHAPLTILTVQDLGGEALHKENFEYAVKYVNETLGIKSPYEMRLGGESKYAYAGYTLVEDYNDYGKSVIFIHDAAIGTKINAVATVLQASLEIVGSYNNTPVARRAVHTLLEKLCPELKVDEDAEDPHGERDDLSNLDALK